MQAQEQIRPENLFKPEQQVRVHERDKIEQAEREFFERDNIFRGECSAAIFLDQDSEAHQTYTGSEILRDKYRQRD